MSTLNRITAALPTPIGDRIEHRAAHLDTIATEYRHRIVAARNVMRGRPTAYRIKATGTLEPRGTGRPYVVADCELYSS